MTRDERTRVERSLAPSVTALQVLGGVAGLATLTVVGLLALRSCRRVEPESGVWVGLGMTPAQRAAAVALPLAVAGVVGLAGALAVAWLASGTGPVGSARALEPDAPRSLPLPVAGGAVALAAALLAAEFATASLLASRRRVDRRLGRPSRVGQSVLRLGHVPLALGARAALPGNATGAGATAVLAGAVTVVAAVVTSAVFSSNLSRLVGTPARFGWSFDAAAVVNYGYGGADQTAVAVSLDRPEVEAWGLAALPSEVRVRGQSLPALAGGSGFDELSVPVVEGRYPNAAREIALGVRSARRLGLAVGDRVAVTTPYGDRDAEVSALVVLPSLGPFAADRIGLGTGILLPAPFFDGIVAGAESDRGLEPGELAASLPTFVGVDLRDGVDATRFAEAIGDEAQSWDPNGFPVLVFSDPVRPPEIADAAGVRSVPAMVATLLAATMALALVLAVTVATRGRRRELSILRAVGCTTRQLRSTVRWHAVTVVAVGLAGGLLAGASLGSAAWRAFAGRLGVVSSVAWPTGWLAAAVAAALTVALVAAAVPARLAAVPAAAHTLREE